MSVSKLAVMFLNRKRKPSWFKHGIGGSVYGCINWICDQFFDMRLCTWWNEHELAISPHLSWFLVLLLNCLVMCCHQSRIPSTPRLPLSTMERRIVALETEQHMILIYDFWHNPINVYSDVSLILSNSAYSQESIYRISAFTEHSSPYEGKLGHRWDTKSMWTEQ